MATLHDIEVQLCAMKALLTTIAENTDPTAQGQITDDVSYDFATDGGTVGTKILSKNLPENAVITNAYYVVTTPFTSGTSTAEIAMGVNVDDPDGILPATVITSAGTAGAHNGTPDGVASNFTTMTTASRAIVLTVSVEALTAGALTIYFTYIVV